MRSSTKNKAFSRMTAESTPNLRLSNDKHIDSPLQYQPNHHQRSNVRANRMNEFYRDDDRNGFSNNKSPYREIGVKRSNFVSPLRPDD